MFLSIYVRSQVIIMITMWYITTIICMFYSKLFIPLAFYNFECTFFSESCSFS